MGQALPNGTIVERGGEAPADGPDGVDIRAQGGVVEFVPVDRCRDRCAGGGSYRATRVLLIAFWV
jgi:hypothetical protein